MTGNDRIFSLADIVEKLPEETPDTMRFHYALRHGTMKLGLYGPRKIDTQTSHKQDELYVVASGSGYFRKNGERRRFKAHDVIFVEAGAEHRFEEFTEDFLTWVIFWGPEGGES
jgi:mannose-6-phosphate isomerase-like protein (cupin superfamily)